MNRVGYFISFAIQFAARFLLAKGVPIIGHRDNFFTGSGSILRENDILDLDHFNDNGSMSEDRSCCQDFYNDLFCFVKMELEVYSDALNTLQ